MIVVSVCQSFELYFQDLWSSLSSHVLPKVLLPGHEQHLRVCWEEGASPDIRHKGELGGEVYGATERGEGSYL